LAVTYTNNDVDYYIGEGPLESAALLFQGWSQTPCAYTEEETISWQTSSGYASTYPAWIREETANQEYYVIDSDDKTDVGTYAVRYEITLKDGTDTIATDVAIFYINLIDVCTIATLSK
jgi:hypothetical protein